jgi:hypothetical protein
MHAKTSPMARPQIAAVRGFNRLFTRIIATLRERLLTYRRIARLQAAWPWF